MMAASKLYEVVNGIDGESEFLPGKLAAMARAKSYGAGSTVTEHRIGPVRHVDGKMQVTLVSELLMELES